MTNKPGSRLTFALAVHAGADPLGYMVILRTVTVSLEYGVLRVAYSCVTFIVDFENIPVVRRPSSRRKAEQNMHASISLVGGSHVTPASSADFVRRSSGG